MLRDPRARKVPSKYVETPSPPKRPRRQKENNDNPSSQRPVFPAGLFAKAGSIIKPAVGEQVDGCHKTLLPQPILSSKKSVASKTSSSKRGDHLGMMPLQAGNSSNNSPNGEQTSSSKSSDHQGQDASQVNIPFTQGWATNQSTLRDLSMTGGQGNQISTTKNSNRNKGSTTSSAAGGTPVGAFMEKTHNKERTTTSSSPSSSSLLVARGNAAHSSRNKTPGEGQANSANPSTASIGRGNPVSASIEQTKNKGLSRTPAADGRDNHVSLMASFANKGPSSSTTDRGRCNLVGALGEKAHTKGLATTSSNTLSPVADVVGRPTNGKCTSTPVTPNTAEQRDLDTSTSSDISGVDYLTDTSSIAEEDQEQHEHDQFPTEEYGEANDSSEEDGRVVSIAEGGRTGPHHPWEAHKPLNPQQNSWVMLSIHEHLKELKQLFSRRGERSNRRETADGDVEADISTDLRFFPIKNLPDLEEVELLLRSDHSFRKQLSKKLGLVGGNTWEDAVFKTMYSIISCELARSFTFDGKSVNGISKRAFKDLRLAYFVKAAIQAKFTVDDVSIGRRIGRWLTTAKPLKAQKKKRLSQFDASDLDFADNEDENET